MTAARSPGKLDAEGQVLSEINGNQIFGLMSANHKLQENTTEKTKKLDAEIKNCDTIIKKRDVEIARLCKELALLREELCEREVEQDSALNIYIGKIKTL